MKNFLKVLLLGTVLVSVNARTEDFKLIETSSGGVASYRIQDAAGNSFPLQDVKWGTDGTGIGYWGGGADIGTPVQLNVWNSSASTGGFWSGVGSSISKGWDSTVSAVKDGTDWVVTKTVGGIGSVKDGIQGLVGSHSALNSSAIPTPTVASAAAGATGAATGATGATGAAPAAATGATGAAAGATGATGAAPAAATGATGGGDAKGGKDKSSGSAGVPTAEAICNAEYPVAITACQRTAFAQIKGEIAPTVPQYLTCYTEYQACKLQCIKALVAVAACIEAECDPPLTMCTATVCTEEASKAKATSVHEPVFDPFVMDLGASISRGIQVLMKFFLGDGNKIVADLVYNGQDDQPGGKCQGGNGGAYTGDNGSAVAPLNAVASSITDIPAEANAYPDDIKVQDTDVAQLADLRIKQIVTENAALDELTQDKWAILYRAQQRSIQAMTDALVMKKAYAELASVAGQLSSGSYGNYSEAASTVATRRLLLDALMALRKRVIAARIRARAETMEMDIEAVSTAPQLEGGQTSQASSEDNKADSTPADGSLSQDIKIEDYGLNDSNENKDNASSENQQQGESAPSDNQQSAENASSEDGEKHAGGTTVKE